MDTNTFDWAGLAKWLWGALVSVLGFLGVRLMKRIDTLERNSVCKPDFNFEMQRQTATRIVMHKENKDDGRETRALLDRIDGKLDACERRRAVVEHEMMDRIHGVALRVEEVNTTAQQAVAAANTAASAATGRHVRMESKP